MHWMALHCNSGPKIISGSALPFRTKANTEEEPEM